MKNRILALLLAATVFVADVFSKYLIMVPLALQERGEIEVTSFFRLIWVTNPGVSMGFLVARNAFEAWLLVALTAAIALGVLVWLWRETNRADTIALGLVFGGALGNIADRVRFGHVVDFANLHFGGFSPFLVFNVADAAITIGVVILLFRALLSRDKTKVAENA